MRTEALNLRLCALRALASVTTLVTLLAALANSL